MSRTLHTHSPAHANFIICIETTTKFTKSSVCLRLCVSLWRKTISGLHPKRWWLLVSMPKIAEEEELLNQIQIRWICNNILETYSEGTIVSSFVYCYCLQFRSNGNSIAFIYRASEKWSCVRIVRSTNSNGGRFIGHTNTPLINSIAYHSFTFFLLKIYSEYSRNQSTLYMHSIECSNLFVGLRGRISYNFVYCAKWIDVCACQPACIHCTLNLKQFYCAFTHSAIHSHTTHM